VIYIRYRHPLETNAMLTEKQKEALRKILNSLVRREPFPE
jgi:hypothetical protein